MITGFHLELQMMPNEMWYAGPTVWTRKKRKREGVVTTRLKNKPVKTFKVGEYVWLFELRKKEKLLLSKLDPK